MRSSPRSTGSTSSAGCPSFPRGARAAHAVEPRWAGRRLERVVGALDVFHFSDWMYPPQRAGIRSTMVHDLVPLHHPEWVHPRTRTHARREVPRTRREACDVVMVNSRFTGDDVAATLGVDRASGSTSPIPASSPGSRRRGSGSTSTAAATRSRSRRSSRARTSSTLVEAYRRLDGTSSRSRVVGAAGWGDQPELDVPGIVRLGYTPREELPRLYRGASRRSSTRRCSRASGCRWSRRWRAACRASRRRIRRSTRRAATPPCAPTPRIRRRSLRRSSSALGDRDELVARGLEHARRFTWLDERPRAPRGVGGGARERRRRRDRARADARRHCALPPRAAAAARARR